MRAYPTIRRLSLKFAALPSAAVWAALADPHGGGGLAWLALGSLSPGIYRTPDGGPGIPEEASGDRQQNTAPACWRRAFGTPHAVQAIAEIWLMPPSRPGNDAAAEVLVREFDAGALAGLREAVLGYATACGMLEDRATDVMLAVHELAANAVRHGAGHGRLRLHVTASTLHCEVSDPGPSSRDGAVPWPVEQGHGLWLVDTTADHLRVTSGPHGSLITVVFTLPAASNVWEHPGNA